MSGWIGVDLDGTLARYDGWKGALEIGAPVSAMVERVQGWIADGRTVKIFTARVYGGGRAGGITIEQIRTAIEDWTETHIGTRLEITCEKDYGMVELYDDRAVQVVPNTGELVGQSTRGLS